jgi:hypothetical protein
MTEQRVTTKAELIDAIERAWSTLNTMLDRLTPSQLMLKDAEGWTVNDHVTNMAIWERSVVFLLQGKPRHAGLGVDERVYEQGDVDVINAVIQQHNNNLPWDDALQQFCLRATEPSATQQLIRSGSIICRDSTCHA